MFPNPKWTYHGLDIAPGKNVDIVVDDMYDWHKIIDNESYDVIITGQCLEHIEEPWTVAIEMYRICKPGGFCCAIAPWHYECHRFPIDCYRFFPDGFRYIFTKKAKFTELDCDYGNHNSLDCWFMGKKEN